MTMKTAEEIEVLMSAMNPLEVGMKVVSIGGHGRMLPLFATAIDFSNRLALTDDNTGLPDEIKGLALEGGQHIIKACEEGPIQTALLLGMNGVLCKHLLSSLLAVHSVTSSVKKGHNLTDEEVDQARDANAYIEGIISGVFNFEVQDFEARV